MINQVRLPGIRRIEPATGLGWVATEPDTATVHLFDHNLRPVGRVPAPIDDPRLEVSTSGRFVAVGNDNEVAVVDHGGTLRWRSPWDRFAGKTPSGGATFHLDLDDTLWARLGAAQELVAVHAATGETIHRLPLAGPEAGRFLPRRTAARTALVLRQPDPSPGALVSLGTNGIALRTLRGLDLADITPTGDRYLTMNLDGFLSVRDLATESVLADRHLDDLPDLPPDLSGWGCASWPVLLTEELILLALSPIDHLGEIVEHVLLSAKTLRHRSRLRYPDTHSPGSIRGAEHPGRWLTRHYREHTLRLWHLDGRLDDEPLPDQITLF